MTTVGRELRRLGFAKLSARPRRYAENEFVVEAFEKLRRPVDQEPRQARRRR